MGVKFILCINRYWTIAARLETGEPAVAGEDVAGAGWARLSFSINFIVDAILAAEQKPILTMI